MIGIHTLWLPILLSSILVFVVSSLIHMFLPWHKSDYPKVPNEDRFMDAVRPLAIPPGDYMVPRPSSTQEMRSAEFAERMKKGPVVIMTVMPSGSTAMGKSLALWFLFCVVVGILCAYVASRALPVAAPYLPVFRFVGITAFIAYTAALWPMSIWYHRAWTTTIKATMDGLIYALLTAGMFGWLWPR